MEKLMNLWNPQLVASYSFCKFKTIKSKNCPKLSSNFPTYILNNLYDLCDLSIDNYNFSLDFVNLLELIAKKSMVALDE